MAVKDLLLQNVRKLVAENIQLGDIVIYYNEFENFVCLVIKKDFFHESPIIGLLYQSGESYALRTTFDVQNICKLPLSLEEAKAHVKAFKIRLEWANKFYNKELDNLTYIEILARLREYETRFS